MRFLIIQTASLSEVILTTSLIQNIKRHYHNSVIDVVIEKENIEILQNNPAINKIYSWNSNKKIPDLLAVSKSLKKIYYNYIINLSLDFTGGLFSLFSKGDTKIGFSRNPLSFLNKKKQPYITSEGINECDRINSVISDMVTDTTSSMKLFPSSTNKQIIARYLNNKFVCIAPGAVSFSKQYPFEKWIKLIDLLNNKVNVYLLGCKADWDICELIICETKHPKVYNFAGKMSYMETAALINNASIVYSNESVYTFIASAMNTNITTIYCSSSPKRGFVPLSDISNIVESKEYIDCRPCSQKGLNKCPKTHFNCATTITANQILKNA